MARILRSNFVRPMLVMALIVLSFAVRPSLAAEKVAIISLKASDQMFSDVDYLLNATGMQALGQYFLPQIKAYFQGTNGQQPIGIVVDVDQNGISPMGFLPVTDLQGFLQRVQEQVGEATDVGDGVMQLQGPQPLFVKESSGWAYFGQTKEALSELPAAPAAMLEGLDQQYDVAMRAIVRNVPNAYKQLAIGQLQQGMARGLAESDDPNQRKVAEAQIAQLTRLIEETDTLTIGWQVDPQGRRTNFDIHLKPIAGSKVAAQLDANRETKTDFGGFLVADAAAHFNMTSVLTPDQIEESLLSVSSVKQSAIKQLDNRGDLDNRTRASAKELLEKLLTLTERTIESGKLDFCGSVVLKPKSFSLIAGGHVASGDEFEGAFKHLVGMAREESEVELSDVQMNVDEHAGVRFHQLKIPVPADQPIRRFLGDVVTLVVGVGDSRAYYGMGDSSLNHLKKAIDDSAAAAQSVDPFHFELSLASVLDFARSIEQNPMIEGVAQMVASAEGKDRIRVRTSLEGDGVLYQFELEEGVLKLLGQLGQLMSMR